MPFEKFTRRTAALTKDPVVGIQKRGTFSLNASAFELVREAAVEAGVPAGDGEDSHEQFEVEFLFDGDLNLIALQPVEPNANSYMIRKQPNSESYLLTGRAFTQHYGIDTESVRRFDARRDGEMVIVNLSEPVGGN